jgi:tRNA1(Val) A37 N6-methylase TrmN6
VEAINYLLGYKELKIVQNTQMFSFSLDSILLPNFIDYKVSYKRILDIGTGNAPIPLVISTKIKAKIDAIEIQKDIFELAVKTIKLNNLEDQINLINDDVLNWYKTVETDTYDLIVCNPPYFKSSLVNENINKKIARHETDLSMENLFMIAKKLLKNKARIVLVHRPERLIDIISIMKKYNIEPKRIQFIYPKTYKDANILLIEGVKNGKTGLKIEKPIYSHNEDGTYTKEIEKYFK